MVLCGYIHLQVGFARFFAFLYLLLSAVLATEPIFVAAGRGVQYQRVEIPRTSHIRLHSHLQLSEFPLQSTETLVEGMVAEFDIR